MDSHLQAASKLAAHWKEEAQRQAALAQAVASPEIHNRLRALKVGCPSSSSNPSVCSAGLRRKWRGGGGGGGREQEWPLEQRVSIRGLLSPLTLCLSVQQEESAALRTARLEAEVRLGEKEEELAAARHTAELAEARAAAAEAALAALRQNTEDKATQADPPVSKEAEEEEAAEGAEEEGADAGEGRWRRRRLLRRRRGRSRQGPLLLPA